jgi:hypothetical protein
MLAIYRETTQEHKFINYPEYNHITYRHLELAYQFILSSRESPGIYPR